MKLSQRLTRAGLTFILLGSVAAVMPNNDTAQATTVDCSGGPSTRYRLTNNLSGDAQSGTIYRNPTSKQSNSITLYTQISRNGGAFMQVGEPLTISDGATSAISFAPTGANVGASATTPSTGVAVYPSTTNTINKSGTVNAMFNDGTNGSYKVQFMVNIS